MENLPVPVHVGNDEADVPKRQEILRFLANLPGFMKTARALSSPGTFRVIMSAENAHLFQQAADGTFKPFLRESGKFVENVDLIKVAPDYAAALSNVLMMVNMAAIAAKLEAIEIGVRNVSQLLANTRRFEVKASIDALAEARNWADPAERREEIRSAAKTLRINIGGLSGQLKAHVMAMPEPETGWLQGFFSNGLNTATEAFNDVNDDIALLIQGISALLRAYDELNEPAVAREAIERILASITEVNLTDAARKARLVPFDKKAPAPEARIGSFIESVPLMRSHLLCDMRDDRPLFSIDLSPEELKQ
jgi:hypothetical protein